MLSLGHTNQSTRFAHTDLRQFALKLVQLPRRDYVTTVEVVDVRLDIWPVDFELMEPDEFKFIVKGLDRALVGDVDVAIGVHANVLDTAVFAHVTVAGAACSRTAIDVVGAAAPADVGDGAVDVSVAATAVTLLLLMMLLDQP